MLTRLFLLALLLTVALALPVTKQKKEEKQDTSTQVAPDMETALEYERYLKEVVEALESDQDFRKKLDKAPEADIRSGKIAQELEYVNHHVRSKLDEIKRREMTRLAELAGKEYELQNGIDREHLKVPQHLDHENEHTFEIEDLQKLIKKTSEDLAAADKKRREEFQQYEMQKEFEREQIKHELDEEQRQKYEKEVKEQQEKHKNHDKVHHPGNKAQLEEVWEKQDHMEKQDFDPRTFFMLHDLDGNGFWDENEVKALFVKELDKVYQSGLPEDDMRERAEEMERMREHVFEETDQNQDHLISFQEFIDQTKRDEFNKDPEWQTIEDKPQYTHEEYLEFERRRQEEVQRLVAQGLLPPHPNMPQGYYPAHPQGQPVMPQGHPQQPQMHYQQPQQQYHQQEQQYQQQQQQYQHHYQQQQPVQQVHLNPNQVYEHVPQQQVVNNAQQQVPQQQQQQYQQVPQQQQYHQVPQQQYQQAPQQQQQQYQQVPQQQQAQQLNNAPVQQQVPQQQQQQVPQQQQQVPQQQQQQVPKQQQVPQQQQQVPQKQQQQVPQQQQQQVPQQQQQQQVPKQQQQQQQVPQQQQQQNIPQKH